MAFIRDIQNKPVKPRDEEDQQTTGGGGGDFQFRATPAGATSSGASPDGGKFGRFVSLGEYLNQNQDEANRMAGKVTSSIAKEGQAAEQGIKQASEAFNTQLNNANKLQNSRFAPGSNMPSAQQAFNTTAKGSGNKYDNALAANKTNANPAQVNERLSDAEGWDKLSENVTKANTRATAVGSLGGVQNEIRNAYNRSPGSRGESLWDASLTQQAGGSQLGQLGSRYGQLSNMLGQAQKDATDKYAQFSADNALYEDLKKKSDDEIEALREADRIAAEAKAKQEADAEAERRRKAAEADMAFQRSLGNIS